VAERTEADGEAGVGDAGPVTKARVGVRQANIGQEPVRRSALELAEDPREMKHAHPRRARSGVAAFYGGDVKTLGELLPEEFVGIGMNDAPSQIGSGPLQARERFMNEEVDSSASRFLKRRRSGSAISSCFMGATRP
jgi:hypothetical protein